MAIRPRNLTAHVSAREPSRTIFPFNKTSLRCNKYGITNDDGETKLLLLSVLRAYLLSRAHVQGFRRRHVSLATKLFFRKCVFFFCVHIHVGRLVRAYIGYTQHINVLYPTIHTYMYTRPKFIVSTIFFSVLFFSRLSVRVYI